jgi:hypothetical protein
MTCEETLGWYQLCLFFSILWILVDLAYKGYEKYRNYKFWKEFSPDPITLTCYHCASRDVCAFVDDPYNTEGDCLASK